MIHRMNQRVLVHPKVQNPKCRGRKLVTEQLPPASAREHHQISYETRNKVDIQDLLEDDNDPAVKVSIIS